MRQIIFDIGSWLSISTGSSPYGILWHPRTRYDGYQGDGDSTVESHLYPLGGYSRFSTHILYLPSVMQGYGHESCSPRNPLVCDHDSARLGIMITACELDKHIAMQHAEQRRGEPRLLVNAY